MFDIKRNEFFFFKLLYQKDIYIILCCFIFFVRKRRKKTHSRFCNALLTFTDINECDTNPCENGGQCTNSEGSFTCSCAGGWRGLACIQGKFSKYLNEIQVHRKAGTTSCTCTMMIVKHLRKLKYTCKYTE